MIKIRYTPKSRATLDGMKPGDVAEVTERYYQAYKDRLTLLADEPDEPIERPAPEEPERLGAIEAIQKISTIDKIADLAPFLDDDRKSVRERAEGRKRALGQ